MVAAERPIAHGSVSPEELIARARAFVPTLRARQEKAEQLRRVPDESIQELLAADLYRILQPKRFGGFEHGLDTFVRVAAEIGSGCGSTAWVYSTAAQHQWLIGMFPPAAQEDVWGTDPLGISAAVFGPTGVAVEVPGGYRLSGKWMFSSGIDNAPWMIGGVKIAASPDSDPTSQGFALFPKADYDVEDNWHVVGLVGTGSKNVIVKDLFIPAHRVLTLEAALSGDPPGARINPGDLYKIPFFAAISICLCAPIMGMAQGALDEYLEATRARMTRGAALSQPTSMAGLPTIQLRVAEALASVDAGRLLVLRDCEGLMATVAGGKALTEEQRARNKGDLGFAVKLSVHAVDRLFESGGGQGLFNENRIQRFWRDIHAAAMHLSVNWDAVGALYGRVSLGQPAGNAQF